MLFLRNVSRFTFHASRISPMPLIKTVVGIRGNYVVSTLLMASLAADGRKFGSYEGLKSGLVDHLRSLFKKVGSRWKKMQGADWNAVYKKYLPLLAYVQHRSDLGYLIAINGKIGIIQLCALSAGPVTQQ